MKEQRLQQGVAELGAEVNALKEESALLSASVGEWQRTSEVQVATAAEVQDRLQRDLQVRWYGFRGGVTPLSGSEIRPISGSIATLPLIG